MFPTTSLCPPSVRPIARQATNKSLDGADYHLMQFGKLPAYYITEQEAADLGWKSWLGKLFLVAPGKMITKEFENRKGKLPIAVGRVWYEVDINYTIGYRNTHRRVYSNDGLVFVTYDHFDTFMEII